MKYRNKNRAPNHSKLGSRKHPSAPRVISMTRVSFDSDGQCIGTEQVEGKLQFDPRNSCYHVMIDDGSCSDTNNTTDIELVQMLEAISSYERANGRNRLNAMTKKEEN